VNRYVLVFCGLGGWPQRDLAHIQALPGVRVIDATNPNVVVVEGRPTVKRYVNRMRNWMASEETVLPMSTNH
jgi:hypothetical protein